MDWSGYSVPVYPNLCSSKVRRQGPASVMKVTLEETAQFSMSSILAPEPAATGVLA